MAVVFVFLHNNTIMYLVHYGKEMYGQLIPSITGGGHKLDIFIKGKFFLLQKWCIYCVYLVPVFLDEMH